MEVQGTSIKSEVVSEEESLTKQHSYVLHGACAACQYGSRTARLVVPQCHGSYVHDMPNLTVEDCKVGENIQIFGYCTCETNPDRIAKMEEILANVKKEDNLLDGIMNGISAVGKAAKGLFSNVMSVFGSEKEEEKPEEPEFAEDLKQNVIIVCAPEFATNSNWVGGSDKLQFKGVPALNSGCTITCIKCGGTIYIVDDGQENAINEQQGAVDFNEWEEGDGLPNLTQRNLEGLERNMSELEAEIDSCTDPVKKAKLQAELEAKQSLQTTMKDNMSMVNELKESLMQSAYCEDVSGAVADMENSGELQKLIEEGTLLDKDNNPITDMDAAKNYMNQYLEDANTTIKQKENDLKIIKESYDNGTPCVKANEETMNSTIQGAVGEAKDNQTKRNWAENGNVMLTGVGTQDDIFTKTGNEAVVDYYLSENKDYSVPYDNFGGQAVTTDNQNDMAYIYHNGKLISQNEYKAVIKDTVGQICNEQNYDWG